MSTVYLCPGSKEKQCLGPNAETWTCFETPPQSPHLPSSPLYPLKTPLQPLSCPPSRSPGHCPDHKAHHTHSLHLFQLSVGNWPSSKARVLEEQVAPMFLARCSWAHWNWTAGRSAEHQGLRAQESGGSGREGGGLTFQLLTPSPYPVTHQHHLISKRATKQENKSASITKGELILLKPLA